jgi:hypothetical protein
VLGRLWRSWQRQREQAALQRRAIPDDLWKRTLVRYPFLQRRDPADAAELRRLTSLFLDRKEFHAVGGLKLTDAIVVSVAAQAVLPVLRLGLQRYDGFVGIVLTPDAVQAPQRITDDDGVVHEFEAEQHGLAMEGGPVMLSWRHVRGVGVASGQAAYNLVIHEFAHVIDTAGQGLPGLPPEISVAEWSTTLGNTFEQFSRRVEAGETTVIDPYGTESPGEFFGVACEAFFVEPWRLKEEHPALYGVFMRYFRQDPAAERPPARRA